MVSFEMEILWCKLTRIGWRIGDMRPKLVKGLVQLEVSTYLLYNEQMLNPCLLAVRSALYSPPTIWNLPSFCLWPHRPRHRLRTVCRPRRIELGDCSRARH